MLSKERIFKNTFKENKMKRSLLLILTLIFLNILSFDSINIIFSQAKNPATASVSSYKFPEFYKGIYLNSYSGKNFDRLKYFIKEFWYFVYEFSKSNKYITHNGIPG